MPSSYVATLVAGLREDSRIKMKRRNDRVPRNTLLLALICDILTSLATSFSKKPVDISVVEILNGNQKEIKKTFNDVMSFSSGEEFERARAQILGKEVQDG